MRLVCCLVLLLGGLQLTCALLVAAWNIQILGTKKTGNAQIMNYIADVIKVHRKYDVIVIQEVRDSDDTNLPVVTELMNHLNPTTTPATAPVYAYIVSGQLGVSTQKERYLYVYNTDTVTHVAVDTYQYPNTNNDFVRPPFAAKFTTKVPAGQPSFDFVMVPLHAKPGSGKTVNEINALDGVVQALPAPWTNILLLGDFNAGGKYLPKKDQSKLTLTTPDYHWLIDGTVVTNLAKSGQPYDRIVANTAMLNHVARYPAGAAANAGDYKAEVYNFVNAANLPLGVQGKDVSDHFPVEVELE